MPVERYSEPYQATGGLAAEGVMNQLGRPDIEPLEVLVREAVQNCWDARLATRQDITVEIGRRSLDESALEAVKRDVLPDPPPHLPLAEELQPGMRILYFADFGTNGLGGPTRADTATSYQDRDFVDFIRNIGQPPDKDFGGGSFGYGKAAFYIASRARTIVVDTLCATGDGLERRLIGAALGENYASDGHTYTGRHWWGQLIDGVPEPLTGSDAARAASLLGLPERDGGEARGTTVAVIAPGVEPDGDEAAVIPFVVEALLWNFWPKMVSTPGGVPRTINFQVFDEGRRVRIPDPRSHERLGPFVDAFDQLRAEAPEEDPTVIDRRLACQRPIQDLGRLVIQKTPVIPLEADEQRAMPRGKKDTLRGLHHVALMRTPELVVKYYKGAEPVTGRHGYAGVFRCSTATDHAFRDAEPPTHDDWIVRSMPRGHDKTFVNRAIEQIRAVCAEAAGLRGGARIVSDAADIPLGEFAAELARLMSGFEGPGARTGPKAAGGRRKRRKAPGATAAANQLADQNWVDTGGSQGGGAGEPQSSSPPLGDPQAARPVGPDTGSGDQPSASDHEYPAPRPAARLRPQLKVGGSPAPALVDGRTPVMRFPFELRARGNRVSVRADVRIMTNDGESVERDPPRGWVAPTQRVWIAADGTRCEVAELELEPDAADGLWIVEIPIVEEAILGVELQAEVV